MAANICIRYVVTHQYSLSTSSLNVRLRKSTEKLRGGVETHQNPMTKIETKDLPKPICFIPHLADDWRQPATRRNEDIRSAAPACHRSLHRSLGRKSPGLGLPLISPGPKITDGRLLLEYMNTACSFSRHPGAEDTVSRCVLMGGV